MESPENQETAVNSSPRLTSIAGVARALIATVGVEEGVAILTAQFGWDVAFSAIARLEGPEACQALWVTLESLSADELR